MSDTIRIETDEGGFYLEVEGVTICRIDDPEALYDHVKAAVGPWLYEREQAFAEFRQAVKSGTGPAAAFICREEDIDESGGYDTSDPKHPDYHSIHADLYDNRQGK